MLEEEPTVAGERKRKAYLQRIRDVHLWLEAGTVLLIDEGEFNDVLIVDNTLVFRFPRSSDGIEHLRVEVAIGRR
jgi:hypothetical protein